MQIKTASGSKIVNKRKVYLKKDMQERFNMKRAWYINAWRIVDENGLDMIQPWFNTKTEARKHAKVMNYDLIED